MDLTRMIDKAQNFGFCNYNIKNTIFITRHPGMQKAVIAPRRHTAMVASILESLNRKLKNPKATMPVNVPQPVAIFLALAIDRVCLEIK